MSVPTQENTAQNTQTEQKSSKEDNLVLMRQHYERQLAQERQARQEAERLAQEARYKNNQVDEDDDDEPYVDKKKLQKHLAKFGEQTQKQTQSEIQKAVQQALAEKEKDDWVKQNPDFYDTVQKHAEQFAIQNPQLAETILRMPQGFAREQLVYNTIKTLGLDKPKQQEPSVQQKIDANRRGPYYQPSGVGSAPYSSQGDYSPTGQKNAYEQMQALKSRLRLG